MLLHDEQTLREYSIPSDSQLVLLHAEVIKALADIWKSHAVVPGETGGS